MRNISAFLVCIHMLLFSVALSWLLLYQTHFLYGVFHEIGGIKEGIEKYAPLNKYKAGFVDTTYEQRVQAFARINHAVHQSGEGLAQITYQTPSSNGVQLLLREPEVVHLQDVANLLDTFKPLFWWGLLVIPTLLLLMRFYKPVIEQIVIPNMKQSLTSIGVVGFTLVLPLIVFGAENVFNQLHIWIFPKEHQWFFYYQESLMSTLMYAPLLFGWIAAAWGLIALCIYLISQVCLTAVYTTRYKTTHTATHCATDTGIKK